MPAIANQNLQTARQSFLDAKKRYASEMHGPGAHDACKSLKRAEAEYRAARDAYAEKPQSFEVTDEDLLSARVMLAHIFEIDGEDLFRLGRRLPR